MKRIIDGYLYDTDNSVLLWTDETNNRRYYVTPNSRYFVVYPNGEITIVSMEYMKNILGKYDIARYIEIFGEPQEG